MSLIKNQNQEQSSTPQEEMKRLWENILSLKAQTRDEAEDKFQVALLLATTEQMCEALTAFTSDIESRLKSLNQSQLKALSLQDVYTNKVDNEVRRMIQNNYNLIEERHKKTLDGLLADLQKATDSLVEKVNKASAKCNQSAECAAESAEKMTSIKEWQDLLQWVSPAAVVLYGIIQLLLRFL